MTRVKKCVAAAAVAVALAGAPTAAYAGAGGERVSGTHSAVGAHSAVGTHGPRTEASSRVVAPGERVEAAPGVELWLETDGKHWINPGVYPGEQFRSVVDGNFDMSRPGVSLQAESSPEQGFSFLSGIYNAPGHDAVSVTVVTDRGTVSSDLIHLEGEYWGSWYATAQLPDPVQYPFVHSVVLRDASGHVLSRLDMPGATRTGK